LARFDGVIRDVPCAAVNDQGGLHRVRRMAKGVRFVQASGREEKQSTQKTLRILGCGKDGDQRTETKTNRLDEKVEENQKRAER
jgi:hypothetical protein